MNIVPHYFMVHVSVEAYNGLARLRTAAALGATVSLFELLSQAAGVSLGSAEPGELLSAVAVLMVVGALMLILGLATWVLKVLGWGNLCKARLRKFYCLTRLIVLGAPIAGMLLILAGVLAEFFRAFSSVATGLEPLLLEDKIVASVSGYIVAGLVTVAAGNVFEGVASFDLGLLTKERALAIGSLLYLAAAAASVLSQVGRALESVSSAFSLAANVLLAAGYHAARKHFTVPPPQPAAAVAQVGGG